MSEREPVALPRSETKPRIVPVALDRPDPQAVTEATRRSFTAEYKLAILDEVAQLSDFDSVGSVLRREGLYATHLHKWKNERKYGALGALGPQPRGPKRSHDKRDTEITRLKAEVARLEAKLSHAQIIIDVQKKISQLLDMSMGEGATAQS